MLRELSIQNIALIQDMTLSFEGGFCALTGETGAGKSIIVDAVSLILGGRSERELIRAGQDKARVEALFDVTPPLAEILEEYGVEHDGTIIFSRELHQSGKNVCRVNGRLQNTSILRQMAGAIVNLHGQNRLAEVLDEKNHLQLLDGYAAEQVTELLSLVESAYAAWSRDKKALNDLLTDEAEKARLLDMYKYQCAELKQAALKAGEEEDLRAEKRKMLSAEKIAQALNEAYDQLQNSARDALARAGRRLEEIGDYDEDYQKMSETLNEAYYSVEDILYTLADEKDKLEFDESRLDEVESRLALISSLTRKYGGTCEAALAYYEEIQKKLLELEDSDAAQARLQAALDKSQTQLEDLCKKLHKARKTAALTFGKNVCAQLADLGMKDARFETEFSKKDYSKNGFDDIHFCVSLNPGQPIRPLAKVISGGEASRFMLAVKCILAERDGIATLVFDEIDAGISGRMAQVVAQKIANLARVRQVICVTHLPQIAAMADLNLLISKSSDGVATQVDASVLSGDDLAAEIARLSGGTQTESALTHAAELLQQASAYKASVLAK